MSQISHRIYRFDGVEIDAARVTLTRGGQEIHLRQKTFQVLIYLIENRERVISKNELVDQIWAGTAITDNSLDQCVAEIRKVLGDDSRQPRFIKTVPRQGFRFIASVDGIAGNQTGVTEAAATDAAEGKAESTISSSRSAFGSQTARWIATHPFVMLVAIVAIIGLPATFYLVRSRPSNSSLSLTLPAGKRSVAVMFFDNESDSADLDWLREGLADMIITDLSRSKNIAVLGRQQLRVLLDRAGHKESEKIRLDEALNIAQKSQAKIVVLGTFARLGEQIRIDVQLHDARDGQILSAERLLVEKSSDVLKQVDVLALKLAAQLGATGEPQPDQGLTSVMTSNLEAYRYYSLAVEKTEALQNLEAIALLEKAVALDPEFAMAYARIGYTYAIAWARGDDAKPFLEKAFKLSSRLSEKDKLYINAWYAIANHDFTVAIKSFREIATRYPLEVDAYSRLGQLLQGEERFNEAIDVLQQALIIDAEAKELYNILGAVYSELGRHDEAIAAMRHYVQLAPREPNAHDSLGLSYQWAGNYSEAIQEYERALALKPDFEIAVIHLGNAYFQQGRYQEATKQFARYIQYAPAEYERSRGFASLSFVEQARGDLEKAQQFAQQALKRDGRALDQVFFVALERGDLKTAERFAQEISSLHNNQDRGRRGSERPFLYTPGFLDLKRGRTEEALNEFKEALTHRPQAWYVDTYEDCLANAYLSLGRFDEAIAEYERILKLNPNYPLAHYHLAQAYQGKGQRDQARAEYEQFLQAWKDADADVPEVVSARKALSA